MNRLVLIPVGGTIAALVAILLARTPREDSPYPLNPPRATRTKPMPEPELPDLPDFPPETESAPSRPPPPPSRETPSFHFRLHADGALTDFESGKRHTSVEDLLEEIAPNDGPRPRVMVTNADDVAETALDAALARLRSRCDVRKDYSAPQDEEQR
jgi:hypothetical protein